MNVAGGVWLKSLLSAAKYKRERKQLHSQISMGVKIKVELVLPQDFFVLNEPSRKGYPGLHAFSAFLGTLRVFTWYIFAHISRTFMLTASSDMTRD